MTNVGFQMWEPYRQDLMAEHRFYVEQARKRLLSQFDNIDAEAKQAAEDYLHHMSVHFDPDKNDPLSFYEAAHDKAIELHLLLADMRENTRLSVTAGMFHQWDKKLKEWIIGEMRHWHHGENASRAIWRADFSKTMDFLATFGFNVKVLPSYEKLNAMRLVVNVFKHGDGSSFDQLKASFPEYLHNPLGGDDVDFFVDYLKHTDVRVSDVQLNEFSEAILDFWKDIPNQIFLSEEINDLKWFEQALLKDRGEV